MRIIKVLFLFTFLFGVVVANEPLLEVKAEGQHLLIHHAKENKTLQEIKVSKDPKKPLIQDTRGVLKKNYHYINSMFSSMNREVDFEKVSDHLKGNPFLLFMECTAPDCPLTRTKNPKPRALFEKRVLNSLETSRKGKDDSKLHLTFFGSSYLFDTLVHVSQIVEHSPNLKSLEIDLVDCLYSEYIEYIRESQCQNISCLHFDRTDKQNWFNTLTMRFALFSSILEQLAPDIQISIRISRSLSHLSQDLVGGSIDSTPSILIAGDLFDDGGGAYAFHDFVVYGAMAADKGAVFLILSRNERSEKKYHIDELVKCTSAEQSREALEKVAYDPGDDWFTKMGKRIKCAFSHLQEKS